MLYTIRIWMISSFSKKKRTPRTTKVNLNKLGKSCQSERKENLIEKSKVSDNEIQQHHKEEKSA